MKHRFGSRSLLVIVFLMLLSTMLNDVPHAGARPDGTPTAGEASATNDAAILRAFLRAVADSTPDLAPTDGMLTMSDAEVAATSGLKDIQDFVMHVEFDSPYTPDGTLWDAGVFFRFGQTPHFRLIVESDGDWYFAQSSDDPIVYDRVTTIDAKEGATTSFDIVAVEGVGFAAINGEYIATFDLSASVGAGSIDLGTSFFAENFIDGATVSYHDFTVWSLDE